MLPIRYVLFMTLLFKSFLRKSHVPQDDTETYGNPIASVALVLGLWSCATLHGCFVVFSIHTEAVVILACQTDPFDLMSNILQ